MKGGKKEKNIGNVVALLRKENIPIIKTLSANKWTIQLSQLFKNPHDTGYNVAVDNQFTECNLLFKH